MDDARDYDQNKGVANLPETSLIICSRNRPDMLWETIQSILAGSAVPTEFIVIDQSDEPNASLVSFQPEHDCKFRYLWSQEKGVSVGRNMAIAAATYPILVFTDDDMLMTPTWFVSIVRALVAIGPRGVVTGQVLASEEDSKGFALSTREDNESVVYRGRINSDVLFTGNMSIYRSAFDQVHGFDTRLGPGTKYPAAEDNDLAFRLLEAGYSIVYDPRSTVYHRAWRSRQESLLLSWSYGCGQGAFYAKYFSLKDIYTIRRMGRNVFGYLVRLPFRMWRQPALAGQDILYVCGLLYGATRWLILRGDERA